MARPKAQAAAPLELRFPARPAELRGMRDALRERLRAWALDDACATDVVMAVDEACQNVIRHAYQGDPDGVIELEVRRTEGALQIQVRDFAPPVDPARIKPRELDELRPGGLGTHLIRSAMDHTELCKPPSGPGNLLRMVKKLDREGGSEA
jgi:sigma-B regulation protein RsbU (phosphoserine phosphatase)